VNYTTYIQPICLSENKIDDETVENTYVISDYDDSDHYEIKYRLYATIVGWGRTDLNHTEKSSTPIKAHIPIRNHEQCRKLYEPYLVSRTMFCAGGDGTDACLVDLSSLVIIPRNKFLNV